MTQDEDELDAGEANHSLSPLPAPSKATEIAVRTALAALVAGGDPLAAAAAQLLAPPLASLTQGAISEWRRHSANQIDLALSTATADAGIDPEALFDRLTGDPKRLLLLRDALQSAAATSMQSKARAFGRAIANGALTADDAKIDNEALVVRALADLESPHVQVLARIQGGTARIPRPGEQRELSEKSLALERLDAHGQAALLQPLLQTLLRNGLVRQVALGESWGEEPNDEDADRTNTWAVTNFGVELLQRLRTAGEDC
ncbi:hypothetical protein [Jatrophihabitans sp.]|uniref:hypothetical protein n=1 Tax=Jatrophihabitans sp. TaxID=1932789 RepID=UPI002BBF2C90|nr:hypothetical protein [Jatrophihabitans sp.]